MSERKQNPRKMPASVTQGSRVLGKTSGRFAGLYACEKTIGISTHESLLEKAVGQLASFDPRVVSVKAQPFTIDVVTGHLLHSNEEVLAHRKTRDKSAVKLREYTPDFLLGLMGGGRLIVEVKDERFMGVESYWVKVEKAKRILLMNGYSFVVVVMKYELSHPLVQNADLLTGFSKNSRIELSATQIETLESALLDHPLELGTVCTRLGLGLRESPVLLLSGLVAADLTESRLCAKTLVRLAHGDLSHLSLLSLAGEQT